MRCRHSFLMEHPGIKGSKIEIPCGRCVACRINKMNEKTEQLWAEFQSCGRIATFITLTYSDAALEQKNMFVRYNGSLVKGKTKSGNETIITTLNKKDGQDFMKRLRSNLEYNGMNSHIKYVMCGEYGGELGRCHMHYVILGYGLEIQGYVEDAWQMKYNQDGKKHLIGQVECKPVVSKGAFRYVLKYIEKEQGEKDYWKEYEKYGIEKPYHIFSKGIGKSFYEEHWEEICENNGMYYGEKNKLVAIPKYYKNLMLIPSYTNYQEQKQKYVDMGYKNIDMINVIKKLKTESIWRENKLIDKMKLDHKYYDDETLINYDKIDTLSIGKMLNALDKSKNEKRNC